MLRIVRPLAGPVRSRSFRCLSDLAIKDKKQTQLAIEENLENQAEIPITSTGEKLTQLAIEDENVEKQQEHSTATEVKKASKLHPKHSGRKLEDQLSTFEFMKKKTTRPFFLKADDKKSIKELRKDLTKLDVPFNDCYDKFSLLERLNTVKEFERKKGVESRFIEHNWDKEWNDPRNWSTETHQLLHKHGLFWKHIDDIVASTYNLPSSHNPSEVIRDTRKERTKSKIQTARQRQQTRPFSSVLN